MGGKLLSVHSNKPRSPLILNGERGFLRVSRLYLQGSACYLAAYLIWFVWLQHDGTNTMILAGKS